MTIVSMIVPIYRTPISYVKECFDSVTRQSYLQRGEIELAVFDEASSEDYQKRLIALLDEIKTVKVIHMSRPFRKGLRFSRNDAIRQSHGDIIILLDSDDVLHKDAVSKCVEAMKERTDFVYSNHIKLSEDLSTIIQYRDKRLYQRLLDLYKGTSYDPLLHSTFIFHCQAFRREVFDKIGGFREDLGNGEEIDFHIRTSELKPYDNFSLIPEYLYYYRNNPSGICNQKEPYEALIRNISSILVEASRRRGMDVIEAYRIGRAHPTNAAHYKLIDSNGEVIKVPYLDYETLRIDLG